MTQVLRSAREIVATDFSFQALLNFGFKHPNLLLMQCDVCQLPLPSNSFDLAMSSQVLEHIPNQQSRLQFMQQLARVLKPGGRLILTVYNWDKNRQAHAVPKEGIHKSDIFYHCYSAEELTGELGQFVKIEKLWGVQTVLPKTYRLVRALGSNYRYWDRLWRRTEIGRAYSNLLLAVGVKQ
jgi:ubiquinone/menaquinone biosynthesis C-methylase UbiE